MNAPPNPDRRPDPAQTDRSLTLTTGGITLLGVLIGIGVTVGFGIGAAWWISLLAGLGTTLGLVAIVKFGTAAGHGPLARLADWVIGSPLANPERPDPRRDDR